MDGPPGRSESLRDGLLAEHARIQDVLEAVIVAARDEDASVVSVTWQVFERSLRAHLDAEDKLVALLPHAHERTARLLAHEHRYLRARLGELARVAAERGLVASTLSDFRDILRAHAQNDDRLLYRWAETQLSESQRRAVLEELASRLSISGGPIRVEATR